MPLLNTDDKPAGWDPVLKLPLLSLLGPNLLHPRLTWNSGICLPSNRSDQLCSWSFLCPFRFAKPLPFFFFFNLVKFFLWYKNKGRWWKNDAMCHKSIENGTAMLCFLCSNTQLLFPIANTASPLTSVMVFLTVLGMD